MKTETSNLQAVVEILGEKTIEQLYQVIGDTPLSFLKLYNYVRKFKIIQSLRSNTRVEEIAKHNKVSRMTVYRVLWNNPV